MRFDPPGLRGRRRVLPMFSQLHGQFNQDISRLCSAVYAFSRPVGGRVRGTGSMRDFPSLDHSVIGYALPLQVLRGDMLASLLFPFRCHYEGRARLIAVVYPPFTTAAFPVFFSDICLQAWWLWRALISTCRTIGAVTDGFLLPDSTGLT